MNTVGVTIMRSGVSGRPDSPSQKRVRVTEIKFSYFALTLFQAPTPFRHKAAPNFSALLFLATESDAEKF